jgi:NADH dehydrogenase
VVRALARLGWRVRVAVRRPDLAGHLQPLGRVGQIHAVQANVRYPASVLAACADADAVVNLAGIHYESGRQSFDAVHVFGARTAAQAARDCGARRLVHVSAIGADARSASQFWRSKAAGEAEVRTGFPDATIMRPSIVFGPEDRFFNLFASLARMSPVLPLIGGGNTAFQPVFAGDVAAAIAASLDDPTSAGKTYELGGPEIKTFRQIMEYILAITGRRRALVPVPFAIMRLKALFLQLLPKPLLTVDQVRMLKVDTVVAPGAATLADLGISPQAIEAVVPQYLERFRKSGQFHPPRQASGGA